MIFENATIITMNLRRQIVEHGAVAVTEKAIVAVGPKQLNACTKSKNF